MIIHVESTETAFRRMQALFDNGQVTEIAGLKILHVSEVASALEADRTTAFKSISSVSEYSMGNTVVMPEVRERVLASLTGITWSFHAYVEKSNLALIDDCVHGDKAAWGEFTHRFHPLISRVVAQVARRHGIVSVTLIDDLVQETYFKLCDNDYKRLRDIKTTSNEAIWGYFKILASNVAHDHFRQQFAMGRGGSFDKSELKTVEERAVTQEQPQQDKLLLLNEITQLVEKVTEGPNGERDRAVFWLYYREGFTAKEIANILELNLTIKGVESVVFRTVSALRNELAFRERLNPTRKIDPT